MHFCFSLGNIRFPLFTHEYVSYAFFCCSNSPTIYMLMFQFIHFATRIVLCSALGALQTLTVYSKLTFLFGFGNDRYYMYIYQKLQIASIR